MPAAASALALAALPALLAGPASGADIDYAVTEYPEVIVNSGGSSDIATVVLSETAAIVCYADWAGDKDGWCNALDLSVAAAAPSKGEDTQLAGVKLRHFTLARFSDSQAVACYVRLGSDGMAVCNVLEVQESDWSLTVGDDMAIDSDTIPYSLQQLDVASFSQTSGVVCYGDANSLPNLKVNCVPFALDATTLSLTLAGEAVRVDDYVHHVQQVIVTAFSDTSAVVCYALEDDRIDELEGWFPDGDAAWCSPIFFDGATLSVGQWEPVNYGATYDLSVARLTDGSGVICYVDGGDSHGKCKPLSFDGVTISLLEVLEVSADTTSNLKVAAMSPTAAMVCFMAGSSQIGKCSGLVMSHGAELAMGDDIEIDSGAFAAVEDCASGWEEECGFFMSVSAYASPINMNGLACYAGLGGDQGARCSMLEVTPPTTTSTTPHTTTETSSTTVTITKTSFTETLTTFTETSSTTVTPPTTTSTTPHTTTETSSTTVTATKTSFTETTETTAETLTSTTPQTTAEASTTEALVEASEGAGVRHLAAAAALAPLAALL